MKNKFNILFLLGCCFSLIAIISSCDKEYTCNCMQHVTGGYDTTFTLAGEGRNGKTTCDAFDSETTDFGITKTVDCEPY